ncbi:MAG: hypothetical protein JNL48_19930 [Acidobacteria bacterium]|nr:hypothetical protein [Acidobacteriota bacterium]
MHRGMVLAVAVAVGAAGLASREVVAHHSFAAEYDRDKPVTLVGSVTKVEWMNPHVYFYLDVKDASGAVAHWAVEGGAPTSLYRAGWRKDSLKIGDMLTVNGFLARDGSKLANMRNAIFPDGREVFGGQQYYSPTVPKPKGR